MFLIWITTNINEQTTWFRNEKLAIKNFKSDWILFELNVIVTQENTKREVQTIL